MQLNKCTLCKLPTHAHSKTSLSHTHVNTANMYAFRKIYKLICFHDAWGYSSFQPCALSRFHLMPSSCNLKLNTYLLLLQSNGIKSGASWAHASDALADENSYAVTIVRVARLLVNVLNCLFKHCSALIAINNRTLINELFIIVLDL